MCVSNTMKTLLLHRTAHYLMQYAQHFGFLYVSLESKFYNHIHITFKTFLYDVNCIEERDVPCCFEYSWLFLMTSLRLGLKRVPSGNTTIHSCKHTDQNHSPSIYNLVGLVVKASASRAEDPGFESRLHRDIFGVESYQ